jgi:hypothetical protein
MTLLLLRCYLFQWMIFCIGESSFIQMNDLHVPHHLKTHWWKFIHQTVSKNNDIMNGSENTFWIPIQHRGRHWKCGQISYTSSIILSKTSTCNLSFFPVTNCFFYFLSILWVWHNFCFFHSFSSEFQFVYLFSDALYGL